MDRKSERKKVRESEGMYERKREREIIKTKLRKEY